MSDYTKPPLGVAPVYVSSMIRIKELADAISRTTNATDATSLSNIPIWANEILMQVEMLHQMRRIEEKCEL